MTRHWVTCGTPTIPGILNPLLAACDRGYIPDELHVLSNPPVAEDVADATTLMEEGVAAYGGEAGIDVHELSCETDFAAIVEAYSAFNEASRKTALLLSNDYGFVDRATDAGVPAQHITFPVDLPRRAAGTWTDAGDLLYYLTVLFGVLTLPKVTLYGVWNGKDGRNWQHEQLDVDCRSPNVEPNLERDLRILAATDSLSFSTA